MDKHLKTLVLALFLAPVALAPAIAGENAPQTTSKKADKTERPQATGAIMAPGEAQGTGFAGKFLSSKFARSQMDIEQASRFAGEALKTKSGDEAMLQQALKLHLIADHMEKATAVSRQMLDKGMQDPLAIVVLFIDAVNKGALDEAESTLQGGLDSGLYSIIRPMLGGWLEVARGKPENPINMDEVIEQSGYLAPFLYYQQALMNDVLGFYESAQANYLKATADFENAPYRVVQAFANFYRRQGQFEEAKELFDHYGDLRGAEVQLPSDWPDASHDPAAIKPLVSNAREGMSEIFFTMASILFSEEATQETFVYLRLALVLKPNFPPAQLMLGNLFEDIKDFDQAVKTYGAIDPVSEFYYRGQVRAALCLNEMGKVEQALDSMDALSEKYPERYDALLTKGDILRADKRYKEAAKAYSSALSVPAKLSEDHWPIYYARGISYERAGLWEKAEADFLKALDLNPSQPDVMNYLGYSWLVEGKNLQQARQLIELALAERPDDAHILDSMGWAHYLMGEFEEAVEYLERAVAITPQDATVNEHLGDAYWQVGRKVEARFQWERALQIGPEPSAKNEIRRKIVEGLSKPQSALQAEKTKPSPVASTEREAKPLP